MKISFYLTGIQYFMLECHYMITEMIDEVGGIWSPGIFS